MRVLSIFVLALLSVSAIQISDEGKPAELGGKAPASKGKKGKEYVNGMDLPPR
jgi:hypothetical protein